MTTTFAARLTSYIRAGYPCVAIETAEEPRALGEVVAAARVAKKGLATWSITDGLKIVLPEPKGIGDTQDPQAALMAAATLNATVIVFRDAQALPFDRDPALARLLRDLLTSGPERGSTVVLLGPATVMYPSIAKLVTVVDYQLPTLEDLKKVVAGIAESCKCANDGNGEVLSALSGLSVSEAENALALSFVETGAFTPAVIFREKIAAVKKSGLLEIVEPDPRGLDAIGGLAALKSWIGDRKAAYGAEAQAYGLPSPKGCLIVGVPGTGKSLAAKAFGTALGVPMLRLDIGALFGSLVGESERRAREALALAEAISPCVLWVEELDKGMAGATGSGSNDSGTTKRVLGTILTWLQEKKRPVFLVATANDVTALPPELLRKGRWDALFSVDLPTLAERTQIAEVQARKHVKSAVARKALDFTKIAEACPDFTGAEIESVMVDALFAAFADGKRLIKTEDVISAIRKAVPLAVTAKAQIDSIRTWAQNNATNAGAPEAKAVTGRKIS